VFDGQIIYISKTSLDFSPFRGYNEIAKYSLKARRNGGAR